jgi:hypothetical protein
LDYLHDQVCGWIAMLHDLSEILGTQSQINKEGQKFKVHSPLQFLVSAVFGHGVDVQISASDFSSLYW